MKFLRQIINDKIQIFNYLLYSIIVAVIDTAIVWFAVRFSLTSLVIANTIGMVTGFLIHYFLSIKKVFNTDYGIAGFIIYVATFIFGLLIANLTITIGYNYIFTFFEIDLRILFSKGLSIVIPFFVLYYLRKYLFERLSKKEGGSRVAP
jgi:putative flippase GtrA